MMNREIVLHTLKCAPQLYPQVLDEQFPHVLEKVIVLWNSPDARAYIADLLNPLHSGGRFDRTGFPDAAWQEILQLQVLRSRLDNQGQPIQGAGRTPASPPTSGRGVRLRLI